MATIPVTSYQSGAKVIGASDLSASVSISPVSLSNSVLLVTARLGDTTALSAMSFIVEFSSASELTFSRNDLDAVSATFEWQVIEFDNSVEVQHFKLNGSFAPGVSHPISSVDLARSVVIPTGFSNAGSVPGADDEAWFRLSSSTTVEIESQLANAAQVATFSVVQFPAGSIQSVQQVYQNAGSLTHDVTISAVDPAKSIMISTGRVAGNYTADERFVHKLTSATTLQLNRRTSGPIWYTRTYIVEFTDYDVVHGSHTVPAGQASATEVLSSSPDSPAVFLNGVGFRPYLLEASNTSRSWSWASWGATLSGSTYTFTRDSSLNYESWLEYSIIDFGAPVGGGVGGSSTVNAASSVSGEGQKLSAGSVSISHSSELIGDGIKATLGAASVSSPSGVSLSGSKQAGGLVSVNANQDIAVSSEKVAEGGVNLTGSSAVSVSGSKPSDGSVTVTVSSSVAAEGSKASSDSIAASVSSSVSTTGSKTAISGVSVTHTSNVGASGSSDSVNSVSVNAVSSVTVSGTKVVGGSVSVPGSALAAVLGKKVAEGVISVSAVSGVNTISAAAAEFGDDLVISSLTKHYSIDSKTNRYSIQSVGNA